MSSTCTEGDFYHRRWLRVRQVGWVLVGILWVWSITHIAKSSYSQQHDLQTYYWAARSAAEGGNPYDVSDLERRANTRTFPWIYPPLMLVVFRPLSLLPLGVALQLWLLLKVGLTGVLLWIWHKHFLQDFDPLFIAVIALLGFRASLLWDLQAGNVSVIEQVLLWSGFAYLMRGRRVAFAAFIVAASLFKLVLIALLPLLFFWPGRRMRGAVIVGGALLVFGALTLAPFAFQPVWMSSWLETLSGLNEVGVHTPSAMAIATDIVRVAIPGGEDLQAAAYWVYVPYALAMLIVSLPAIRRAIRSRDYEMLVMGSLMVFALVVPRFKCYSFVMLIPPTLILWRRMFRAQIAATVAYVPLVAVPGGERLPGVIGIAYDRYYVMLLAIAIWLCYIWLRPPEVSAGGGLGSDEEQPRSREN